MDHRTAPRMRHLVMAAGLALAAALPAGAQTNLNDLLGGRTGSAGGLTEQAAGRIGPGDAPAARAALGPAGADDSGPAWAKVNNVGVNYTISVSLEALNLPKADAYSLQVYADDIGWSSGEAYHRETYAGGPDAGEGFMARTFPPYSLMVLVPDENRYLFVGSSSREKPNVYEIKAATRIVLMVNEKVGEEGKPHPRSDNFGSFDLFLRVTPR